MILPQNEQRALENKKTSGLTVNELYTDRKRFLPGSVTIPRQIEDDFKPNSFAENTETNF